MNILITGGAGYVGTVLADELVAAKHEVTIFDNFMYGVEPVAHLSHRVKLVPGDVRDASAVEVVVKDAEVVLHLAALVGFPLCARDPAVAYAVNAKGSQNVVDCIRGDQLLVFASTGSTYGLVDGECTEDSPTTPLSVYGQTKLAGEEICRGAGGVALRFATLFGLSPCMRFDLLVNTFVYRAIHDKYLVIYEGHHKRTFLHVADAVAAYLLMIARGSEFKGDVFNVGWGALNKTKREIASVVNEHFPFYVHEADVGKDSDCRDYLVNYDKLGNIGFEPQRELSASIVEIGHLASLIRPENRWRIA